MASTPDKIRTCTLPILSGMVYHFPTGVYVPMVVFETTKLLILNEATLPNLPTSLYGGHGGSRAHKTPDPKSGDFSSLPTQPYNKKPQLVSWG